MPRVPSTLSVTQNGTLQHPIDGNFEIETFATGCYGTGKNLCPEVLAQSPELNPASI
ncbi:MAG TPA: hypothetical protein VE422_07525 [Terriglobia bacterium]|nr:hypothetical protein [Terriglobia bacterium]